MGRVDIHTDQFLERGWGFLLLIFQQLSKHFAFFLTKRALYFGTKVLEQVSGIEMLEQISRVIKR